MVFTCMQREGVAAQAQHCLLFLWSTDDQVGFNGKVFAEHIHLRCGHSSHFLSWFLNYSSQEQNIHPFTFTVSCKLRKLSKTLEFEVSLSLIWNNSNIFSQNLWFLITEGSSYVPTSHSDFPINHCSHCLGGRQVDLGFASVYLNFDCAYLRGVSALLVKAH